MKLVKSCINPGEPCGCAVCQEIARVNQESEDRAALGLPSGTTLTWKHLQQLYPELREDDAKHVPEQDAPVRDHQGKDKRGL